MTTPTDTLVKEGMTQLSHGVPIAHSYAASLGMRVGSTSNPLSLQRGLIIGEPGVGKTRIAQSHPGGFIFNFDISGSVYPESNALSFPGIDKEGYAVNERNQRIVLTWERVMEKIEVLKTLASTNQSRPSTVFFDTIPSMIRVVRPHVAQMYKKDDFRDLDGRLGWEAVFDVVLNTFSQLREHGYGVFGMTHIVKRKVPISDNLYADDVSINMSDGLFRRIYGMLDVVIPVVKGLETVEIEKEVPFTAPNGQTKTTIRKITEERTTYKAVFNQPNLQGITKVRTLRPLPPVTLPEKGAWQILSDQFAEACRV